MSVNIKTLNHKRGSIKSRICIFENYLNKIIDNKNSENFIFENSIIIELEHRLFNFDKILEDFERLQNDIEMLEDNPQQDITLREEISSKYYKLVSQCKNLIAELSKNQIAISPPIVAQSNVRLPAISLPRFDGSFDNWLEFRDSFNSLINKNTNIELIQKYQYLKSSLTGNAANLIKSLPVSEANYETAWELICNRFNNKNSLVFNHIKAIFNSPKLHMSTSKCLRSLIDETTKNLRTLKGLGLPTDHWDVLIIHLLSEKLDSDTLCKWEEYKFGEDLPTFESFRLFLESRAQWLEALESHSKCKDNKYLKKNFNTSNQQPSRSFAAYALNCSMCNNSHKLYNCKEFLALTPENRYQTAKSLKLCLNCLESNHYTKKCFKRGCMKCSLKHNVLLHFENKCEIQEESSKDKTIAMSSYENNGHDVLLSTAVVNVFDNNGKTHTCRVLLDSGSQSNFICSDFCQKLKLTTKRIEMSVTGINQISSVVHSLCNLKFNSRINNYSANISCLVVPKICTKIPHTSINIKNLHIPSHIELADPSFNISSKIDMLIGADLFWDLICNGHISLGNKLPILHSSRLGWIVSGAISSTNMKSTICKVSINNLKEQLSRFWELEECAELKILSPQEVACEEHFINNVKRDFDGRFIVSIPLLEDISILGDSRQIAEKRFYSLERKLNSNNSFKLQYHDFIKEYINLGHMTQVDPQLNKVMVFLPHHGVIKEESITTKLRVVFDGSVDTTSGRSLNSIQMVGPTIQDDLFSILIRFRQHKYVITSDIAKMYRQVVVNSKQRNLQCILWRFNSSDPISVYCLNTVTYGTASASFLAIRCLKQLSIESENSFPSAAKIIASDFYVDDLLTGFDDFELAISTCRQIDDILKSGGFELRKWNSNNYEILNKLSGSNCNDCVLDFGLNGENTKTLGLLWSSYKDVLTYNIKNNSLSSITKRNILSSISQIFDPLGLLSPCTIKAKMLLQLLWLKQLDWDDVVPTDIQNEWLSFYNELIHLNNLKINRQVTCNGFASLELHGFADASEKAYGACVYIKSCFENGSSSIQLLSAKSKVAPLKPQSIPKLELCAALTLSKLISKIKRALTIDINEIYLWSDSTIVLNWIQTPPHTLKTFVANRVNEIQSLTSNAKWQHVSSKDNPADLISRGVNPSDLLNFKLWWNGPQYLSLYSNNLESNIEYLEDLPERKSFQMSFQILKEPFDLFNKFSNFKRLQRSLAYCLRFKNNCLIKKEERQIGHLTIKELENVIIILVKLIQGQMFYAELKVLKFDKDLNKNSKIINLSPFLDENGIIRVGGRLSLADLSYDKRHPILLPKGNRFVDLMFMHEHLKLGHAGPQQLLYSIREKFWPLSGKNTAKRIVHSCIKCFKVKPKVIIPRMGDLPKNRISPSLPFFIVGVDYAGPFFIKDRKGKGYKISKAYVALFVCFVTKAIHLELVNDLSKDAFIAALRRFMGRRGKPLEIHSDNGTNFVGANNDLKEFYKFLNSQSLKISEKLSNEGISWKFIVPHSPHLGGLWEAGIKSMKFHIKRVIGLSKFTFDEFYTVLVQIEAILNSRPLYASSNDPNDLNPITPSHFLIGRNLTSTADPNLYIPEKRMSKYQFLQHIRRGFWSRWSKEYLNNLQTKNKNLLDNLSPSCDTIVLLKEDNLPPLYWSIGKIVELHSGLDGRCRIVSVRTKHGIVKRALSKICPLPLDTF